MRVRRRGVGRMWRLGWSAAALVLGAPASRAADAPPAMPLVDATVVYRVAPEGGRTQTVTVRFADGGGLLRIDGADGGGATILDRARSRVTVVVDAARAYSVLPTKGPIGDPFMLSASMQYARTGTRETIAGQACDDWRVRSDKGTARACVTPEGVLLQATGVDGSGVNGSITALRVSLAPVPASAFAPPPGYRRVEPAGTP